MVFLGFRLGNFLVDGFPLAICEGCNQGVNGLLWLR